MDMPNRILIDIYCNIIILFTAVLTFLVLVYLYLGYLLIYRVGRHYPIQRSTLDGALSE